ncbi:hypothetical protein N9N22_03090 [Alphaproteobacteria bacterium]|nr:hypothetical protein [Alphaproteobacteria bacterium]
MADIIEFSAYLFDKSKIKELSVHARRHLKTVLGADCSPFLIEVASLKANSRKSSPLIGWEHFCHCYIGSDIDFDLYENFDPSDFPRLSIAEAIEIFRTIGRNFPITVPFRQYDLEEISHSEAELLDSFLTDQIKEEDGGVLKIPQHSEQLITCSIEDLVEVNDWFLEIGKINLIEVPPSRQDTKIAFGDNDFAGGNFFAQARRDAVLDTIYYRKARTARLQMLIALLQSFELLVDDLLPTGLSEEEREKAKNNFDLLDLRSILILDDTDTNSSEDDLFDEAAFLKLFDTYEYFETFAVSIANQETFSGVSEQNSSTEESLINCLKLMIINGLSFGTIVDPEASIDCMSEKGEWEKLYWLLKNFERYDEAFQVLKVLMEGQPSQEVRYAYAYHLYAGFGTRRQTKGSKKELLKLASEGYEKAYEALFSFDKFNGGLLENVMEDSESIISHGIELKIPRALVQRGLQLFEGVGTKKDKKKGKELIEMASSYGSSMANYVLGDIALLEDNSDAAKKKASVFYMKALDAGSNYLAEEALEDIDEHIRFLSETSQSLRYCAQFDEATAGAFF